MFSYDFWLASEIFLVDEWACSDPTLPADIVAAGHNFGVETPPCNLSSPRRRDFRDRATAQRRRRPRSKPRRIICYVPTHRRSDFYVMSGAGFDDAWYGRWQLSLLQHMARQSDRDFVWKVPPAGTMRSPDQVPDALRRHHITNVRYDTRSFRTVVPEVDRVFLDFASTAFYESVHLGLPVLAVSFSRFEDVRASAAAMFGKSLQRCDGEAEALDVIDKFLDDDREQWVIRPPDLLALSAATETPRTLGGRRRRRPLT